MKRTRLVAGFPLRGPAGGGDGLVHHGDAHRDPRGRAHRAARSCTTRGPELDAVVSYRFANSNPGEDWLFLDVALTADTRTSVEVKREKISSASRAARSCRSPPRRSSGQAYGQLAAGPGARGRRQRAPRLLPGAPAEGARLPGRPRLGDRACSRSGSTTRTWRSGGSTSILPGGVQTGAVRAADRPPRDQGPDPVPARVRELGGRRDVRAGSGRRPARATRPPSSSASSTSSTCATGSPLAAARRSTVTASPAGSARAAAARRSPAARGAGGGSPSAASTSSAESTGAAPARSRPFGPADRRENTEPGTAITSRPSSRARRAVISAPGAFVRLDHDDGLRRGRR